MSAPMMGAGNSSRAVASSRRGGAGRRRQDNAATRREADRAKRFDHDRPCDELQLNARPGDPVALRFNRAPSSVVAERKPQHVVRGAGAGNHRPVGMMVYDEIDTSVPTFGVDRFVQVHGPALPGQPWGPVRYRVTRDDAERRAALEAQVRAQQYRNSAGDVAARVVVTDPAVDVRPEKVRRTDLSTPQRGIRKRAARAYGAVCEDCGTMHRGECV